MKQYIKGFDKDLCCRFGVFLTETPKTSTSNMPYDYALDEFMETENEDLRSTWGEKSYKLNSYTDVCLSYTDICRMWWCHMTPHNRDIITSVPVFDIDIFCEITGIKKEDVLGE